MFFINKQKPIQTGIFIFVLLLVLGLSAYKIMANQGYCIHKMSYFNEEQALPEILHQITTREHELYHESIHRHIAQSILKKDLSKTDSVDDLPILNLSQIHQFIRENPKCCEWLKGEELKFAYVEALPAPAFWDSLTEVEFEVLYIYFTDKENKSLLPDETQHLEILSVNFCGKAQYRKNYINYYF